MKQQAQLFTITQVMCLALREAMAVLPDVASELVPDVLLGISDGGPCATNMATTYAASCHECVAGMHYIYTQYIYIIYII